VLCRARFHSERGRRVTTKMSYPMSNLCLGVIEGYVDEKLDEAVSAAFQAALTRLSQKGVRLKPLKISELAELSHILPDGWPGGRRGLRMAPKPSGDAGQLLRPVDPGACRGRASTDRRRLHRCAGSSHKADAERARSLALLRCPGAALGPDLTAYDCEPGGSGRVEYPTNVLCLRNASIANFLDRPAISIPCHPPGSAPVGIMLMGETGEDRRLLSIARGLEYTIRLN